MTDHASNPPINPTLAAAARVERTVDRVMAAVTAAPVTEAEARRARTVGRVMEAAAEAPAPTVAPTSLFLRLANGRDVACPEEGPVAVEPMATYGYLSPILGPFRAVVERDEGLLLEPGPTMAPGMHALLRAWTPASALPGTYCLPRLDRDCLGLGTGTRRAAYGDAHIHAGPCSADEAHVVAQRAHAHFGAPTLPEYDSPAPLPGPRARATLAAAAEAVLGAPAPVVAWTEPRTAQGFALYVSAGTIDVPVGPLTHAQWTYGHRRRLAVAAADPSLLALAATVSDDPMLTATIPADTAPNGRVTAPEGVLTGRPLHLRVDDAYATLDPAVIATHDAAVRPLFERQLPYCQPLPAPRADDTPATASPLAFQHEARV